ncbi:MAG: DUF6519 domain-containing protein [Chloroflexota bacterium]
MKGDFTRDTFDARQHFSRVLMQQGRVQLDADWNEQVAILLHYLQALAEDLIGPCGGPSDIGDAMEEKKYGFAILTQESGNKITDLKIGRGRYYVNGILCENDPHDDGGNPLDEVSYFEQNDYPLDRDEDKLPDPPFLVYLDVWERHLTSLESPGIREVALGGPDTATRARIVWQVKVWPTSDQDPPQFDLTTLTVGNIDGHWQELRQNLEATNRGELTAWTDKPGEEDSVHPCTTDPEARYRGAENRLYRVEIHKGGEKDEATFKWSRDNGSVAASWVGKEGDGLLVSGVRDLARGFAPGQWVELTHDDLELKGEPGIMARLVKVEGERLTIDPATASDVVSWSDQFKNPKVRRWDHQEVKLPPGSPQSSQAPELSEGAILVKEGLPIRLEEGITIEFTEFTQTGAQYRSGDYWLIPARTATGDVEWPTQKDADGNDQPVALPPHGVEHHYAPLAVVKIVTENGGEVVKAENLRHEFAPAWKHELKVS